MLVLLFIYCYFNSSSSDGSVFYHRAQSSLNLLMCFFWAVETVCCHVLDARQGSCNLENLKYFSCKK